MPETYQQHKVFSLLEITLSIQRAFKQWYSGAYWIKAEMNKLNHYKYSGHCYPDLLERQDGKVVAQIRATLWDDDYRRINATFLQVLNEPLKDGINILFLAKVTFSPVHGLSLSIIDIDPAYTLGDLEREKLETISRLKTENLFNQNKLLPVGPLLQRIAIISVETSKGLADFLKVLNGNRWDYRFFTLLFPALLQGDKAPESIMGQLRRIRRVAHHFDAVAIVRGGGGDVGLASYNHFDLSRAVASFPLPVLTGIGHSTNETVVEMVAHLNAITPTELADFLIQRYRNFDIPLENFAKKIRNDARQTILTERQQLTDEMRFFKSVTSKAMMLQYEILNNKKQQIRQSTRSEIKTQFTRIEGMKLALVKYSPTTINSGQLRVVQSQDLLSKVARNFLKTCNNELQASENQLRALHPDNVLKRGYSITRLNGKSISDVEIAGVGDEIETTLYKGKLKSKILAKSNNTDHEQTTDLH